MTRKEANWDSLINGLDLNDVLDMSDAAHDKKDRWHNNVIASLRRLKETGTWTVDQITALDLLLCDVADAVRARCEGMRAPREIG